MSIENVKTKGFWMKKKEFRMWKGLVGLEKDFSVAVGNSDVCVCLFK